MLATLGFVITGLCFGIFAYTFNTLVIAKTNLKFVQFAYAYYCLGLALLTWGVAAAIGGDDLLRRSVIVGNSFLLLGTLFMLSVWLGQKNRSWVWLAAVIAIVLLYVRASHYPPTPYMKDGILIFNTQTPVAIVLGLIFTTIWLPVNLGVARTLVRKIGQEGMASIYSAIYLMATLSALLFLAARRVATVILSFAALTICFVMLVASNIFVKKVEEHRGTARTIK
jgi:hypothetical protein